MVRLESPTPDDWARVDAQWNPAWRWVDSVVETASGQDDVDRVPLRGSLGWRLMVVGADRVNMTTASPLPACWQACLGLEGATMSLLEAVCLRLWHAGGDRGWDQWASLSGSCQPPVAEALHQNWSDLAAEMAGTAPHLGQNHPGLFGPVETPLHVAHPDHLALVLSHGADPNWPAAPEARGEDQQDSPNWRRHDGPGALHQVTSLAALEALLDAGVTTTPLTPMGAPAWPDAAWGAFPTDMATWMAMADRLADHRQAHGVDPRPGRLAMLAHAWTLDRLDLADALGRPAWLASLAPLVLPSQGHDQGILALACHGPVAPGDDRPWPYPGLGAASLRAPAQSGPAHSSWERLRIQWLVPARARPDLLSHASTHMWPLGDPLTVSDGAWAWARWVSERVYVNTDRVLSLPACDTDPTDATWQAIGACLGATPADRWAAYLRLCLRHPGPGHWSHPWLLSGHPMGAVLGPLVLDDLPSDLVAQWWSVWRDDQESLLTAAFLPVCWDRACWTLRGRYPAAVMEAVLSHGAKAVPSQPWGALLLGEWALHQRLLDQHDSDVLAWPSSVMPHLDAWGHAGGRAQGWLAEQPEIARWLAHIRQKELSDQVASGKGRARQRG